jgi:hypothetical protein
LEEARTRLTEEFVFLYAVGILLSGLLLTAIGVQQIEIYYVVYLIEFLVVTELAASLRQSLGSSLRIFILVFLAGFLYTLIERILQILG